MLFSGRKLSERLRYIRKRSLEKCVPCDLSEQELVALLNSSGTTCPCCHLPYIEGSRKKQRTVDRIRPETGYTITNLQILCGKCNRKKGTAVVRYGR